MDNWIPYTYAEHMMMRDVFEKIPEETIAESVVEIEGISDRRALIIYDETIAEFSSEKDARFRKYLRNHYVRNDGKPQKKDKRKCYEKEKCRSCDPWRGWDTWQKYRREEMRKSDDRDYVIECRNIAEDAEAEAVRNAIIAEYERIEEERKWAEESRKLREWLKWA